MSLGPLYVLLGEVSVQIFCPFFNWVVCLPGVESYEFFIYLGDQTLVRGIIGKYVFPYKPLSRLIKKKKERTQINTIRNERGEISTDTTEIQRIIRNYYEELYAKKFVSLDEMDIFLERCNLPKLNEEAESLNRPITADKIEAVVKKLLAHKSPALDVFTGEFYKAFKEELTPIFHRLFQKIQENGHFF